MINISNINRAIVLLLLFSTLSCAGRYGYERFAHLNPEQKRLLDSVGRVIAGNDEGDSPAHRILDSLYRIEESCFHAECDDRDTTGAYRRFRRALSPVLADAVGKAVSYYKSKVLQCRIERDTLMICPAAVMPEELSDARGYLLCSDKLIAFTYSERCAASGLLKPSFLEKEPYNRYKVFYTFVVMNYDGPVDLYRIVREDSMQFLGRGYLTDKGIFYPLEEDTNASSD